MKTDKTSDCVLLPFPEEARLHIDKICRQMEADNLDTLLIADNANIYYCAQRFFRGYVFVTADRRAIYFIVRPDCLAGDNAVVIRKPEQIAEHLAAAGISPAGRLGLELGILPYSEIIRLQKALPGYEYTDCTLTLKHARMTKTEWEISQMRRDGELQAAVFAKVPSLFREGMTDIEMQIAIEQVMRRHGWLGLSRVSGRLMELNSGTVLTGENADRPFPYEFAVGGGGVDPAMPVGADGSEILNGNTLMADMNGCFNGYQTDMTRTWSVGTPSEHVRRAYDCVLEIHRMARETSLPGSPLASLYERAGEIAKRHGLEKYYMGHAQKAPFLGHGVGIELNELPVVTARSRDLFEENMTIALEPKFVLPGIGGVGLENTYLVTANGLESLTPAPENLESLI